MAARLVGVCTNPNGEGVWWRADSLDDPCIAHECDCTPDFYVPVSGLQGEIDRMRTCGEGFRTAPPSRHAVPSEMNIVADRLQALLDSSRGEA